MPSSQLDHNTCVFFQNAVVKPLNNSWGCFYSWYNAPWVAPEARKRRCWWNRSFYWLVFHVPLLYFCLFQPRSTVSKLWHTGTPSTLIIVTMGRYSGKACRLICMLCLTSIFFLVEIIVGYITNSLALVGDSYHMLSDVVALMVGFASVRVCPDYSAWNKTHSSVLEHWNVTIHMLISGSMSSCHRNKPLKICYGLYYQITSWGWTKWLTIGWSSPKFVCFLNYW